MQSVERENAVSDLSRAVPLRGCYASSLAPRGQGQGREGSAHARACTFVCMCTHILESQNGLFSLDESLVSSL